MEGINSKAGCAVMAGLLVLDHSDNDCCHYYDTTPSTLNETEAAVHKCVLLFPSPIPLLVSPPLLKSLTLSTRSKMSGLSITFPYLPNFSFFCTINRYHLHKLEILKQNSYSFSTAQLHFSPFLWSCFSLTLPNPEALSLCSKILSSTTQHPFTALHHYFYTCFIPPE